MSTLLELYLDDATQKRLEKLSKEMGRTIADLAECAVSEAALSCFRHRKDDPGRKK